MKLETFEEWLAIRRNDSDDTGHLPGRLTFDLDEGIFLDTIRFFERGARQNDPIISGDTLTGWLGYQQPATLIEPRLQQINMGTASVNHPALRESRRFVASAILKNVFLEDIKASIFTGLIVEHPAFHAWVNPRLVSRDWSEDVKLPTLSVDVQPPRQRHLTLPDGTSAEVVSVALAAGSDITKVEEHTTLKFEFREPVNFGVITRMAWRISSLFEFLIGARVSAPLYWLPTTQKRQWNDEDQEIIAEYWYRPAHRKRRRDDLPDMHDRLITEERSPISLETLLSNISRGSDELIFLADQIQTVEDFDLSITQGFGEILGCLEAFDDRTFGSGADENFNQEKESLKELVNKHGSDANRMFFERISGAASNRFSLLKRLERLHQKWNADGFRTNPDLKRIRDLRNVVPHGRGLEVSSEVAQEMAIYLRYLAALGRYHVLKILGFTGEEIADVFMRQPHRYGLFVPERIL
ncbi:ApeA N-terminal domain 1-containing protein [Rhodopseudomonas parapalustris]